jgi:molecular chaperone GrpE (heat shock protein)
MKSALELAMAKADDALGQDKEYVKLGPEQIAAIDQIKKQYEAKWAEQEIALKGRLKKLASEVDPATLQEHYQQLQAEIARVRERIYAERDEKIEAIRRQQKG